MKNIWLIFTGDLRRTLSNVIGVIVFMGLAIIPTLYAWFNIAACWEPYGNTDQLKVAVVNLDDGYRSDVLPTRVSIGDDVVSSLHSNAKFDWVFVNNDEAMDGVNSGEYYAAIVIPKNFSRNMMSLFSDSQKTAKITYYTNEKENPIAPRITDSGASAIQSSISQSFSQVVDESTINVLSDVLNYLDSGQVKRSGAALTGELETAASGLDTAAVQVRGYASMAGASSSLVKSTTTILGTVDTSNTRADSSLAAVQKTLSESSDSVSGISKTVNEALKQSSGSFDALSTRTDSAFDTMSLDAEAASNDLSKLAAQVQEQESALRQLRSGLASIVGSDDSTVQALGAAVSDLDDLASTLGSTANGITSAISSASAKKADIDAKIKAAQDSVSSVQGTYEKELLDKLSQLDGTLGKVRSSSSSLSDKLGATIDSLSNSSDTLTGQLDSAKDQLNSAADDLDKTADNLRSSSKQLKKAFASGDLKKVQKIIGNDSVSLAQYLSSPVEMDRHAVYGIANYGSSMAPFYTCLSLWVAAVVFVVIMRTDMSDERRRELKNLKPYQEFLGRFGIFALLSVAQSTLLCLGDLYFMGIQCMHPFLFLLSGWIIGLAFMLIVYTLTLSFGNVGKALSVILLVMQVAGSGGIFPVQMEGDLFQALYPYLPFVYSMKAMQSCIAGIYGNEYVLSLLVLAAFTIPFWLLGLVLRNPTIKLNKWVKAKLEETKFM